MDLNIYNKSDFLGKHFTIMNEVCHFVYHEFFFQRHGKRKRKVEVDVERRSGKHKRKWKG
jgi:hypothetical protein